MTVIDIYKKLRSMRQDHDDSLYESVDICLIGRIHMLPVDTQIKLLNQQEAIIKGGGK